MGGACLAEVQGVVAAAPTPAFLLAGVGALLNLLSQRRNRVVDRLNDAHAQRQGARRLAHLRLRARLARLAMQACILAAAMVCLLVGLAFLGRLHAWPLAPAITLLALGLLCFLAKTFLARTDLPP